MPVVPEPDKLPEGVPVTVHAPDAGNPLKATLPVIVTQVGWVIVPTVGAEGTISAALTTALPEAADVQLPLLTVNV